MENLKIRMMDEQDLAAVEALEKACFAVPWSYELLADAMQNQYDFFWALLDGENVIAYCNLRVLAGEGEIMRIAVDKAHRRQGLGRKLMEEMLAFAEEKNCEEVVLEVRESNDGARKLYEAYGFTVDGIRKQYYEHPVENAVLMGRRPM